jgi:hypothetical protein
MKEAECSGTIMYFMHENGKLWLADTIPETGENEINKNDGEGEINYEIL